MLYGQLSNSLIHQLTNTLHASRDTLHEIALQLSRELYKSNLFLQNKANFKNDRIYTSTCDKGSYGNLRAFFRRKNKAKQSQSKPNFGPKLALLFINFSNVVTCLLKII
jgi:hypothetical protein